MVSFMILSQANIVLICFYSIDHDFGGEEVLAK